MVCGKPLIESHPVKDSPGEEGFVGLGVCVSVRVYACDF